jgi:hypothetical protein
MQSRESRKTGVTLIELAKQKRELAPYLKKVKPHAQEILDDPARYIGAAPARTGVVCDHWEVVCDTLRRSLEVEGQVARQLRERKTMQSASNNGQH